MTDTPQARRKVFVRGLKIDAHIGVYDHEYGQTQPLLVDFEIEVTPPHDPQSDNLEDVLCYNRFSQGIQELADSGHIKLVETFGEQICDLALTHPMTLSVQVRIEKVQAIATAESAGVEIYREKHK